MKHRLKLIGVAGAALAPACAASFAPAFAQEWSFDASTTVVGAALDEDGLEGEPLLGNLRLSATATSYLDNGVVLTWSAQGRAERDASSRPAFGGVIGPCEATVAGCPAAPGGLSPVSPVTGLAAGGTLKSEDVQVGLDALSLSVRGPWGEGVFGYDSGAATLLDARAPQVLTDVSAFSPSLDPTGAVLARARNDATGASAKATYMSPRWLGFRVGASYTPEANLPGLDFDPSPGGGGLLTADLEQVGEAAISFARTFRSTGTRVRAALTAVRASSGAGDPAFGDYRADGAGLELEQGAWTGGVRWLSSNSGWRAGPGDYEALEVGLVRQGERWRFGAEYATADDDLTQTEGTSWLVGVGRKLGDHVDLGVAYMRADMDFTVSPGGFRHIDARNGALMVELSVRK